MREGAMSALPDFKAYCEAACIKLWGQPDKRTSKELRWNGGGATTVRTFNLCKKVWYDHGAQRGGSTLELVAYHFRWPADVELRREKFFEAWRSGNTLGVIPESPPPPKGVDTDAEAALAELNRDNCVVLDGTKTMVLLFEETEHAAGGEHYVIRVPTFLRFQDFRNFYLNRHIM